MLLLRGAPDYSIDTVTELTRRSALVKGVVRVNVRECFSFVYRKNLLFQRPQYEVQGLFDWLTQMQ